MVFLVMLTLSHLLLSIHSFTLSLSSLYLITHCTYSSCARFLSIYVPFFTYLCYLSISYSFLFTTYFTFASSLRILSQL